MGNFSCNRQFHTIPPEAPQHGKGLTEAIIPSYKRVGIESWCWSLVQALGVLAAAAGLAGEMGGRSKATVGLEAPKFWSLPGCADDDMAVRREGDKPVTTLSPFELLPGWRGGVDCTPAKPPVKMLRLAVCPDPTSDRLPTPPAMSHTAPEHLMAGRDD